MIFYAKRGERAVVKNLAVCFLTVLSLSLLAGVSSATILVVDDFDSGLPVNNVGGETGAWNCNPQDTEQFCKIVLIDTEKVGEAGFCLRLTYDISSTQDYVEGFPQTAYNGYWSLLNGLDVSDYTYLSFWLKGDKNTGHTDTLWVELKDPTSASRVKITGISDEWQKIKIPMEKFTDIYDWANLTEFMIIFNETASAKEGIIYIDTVGFNLGRNHVIFGTVPRGNAATRLVHIEVGSPGNHEHEEIVLQAVKAYPQRVGTGISHRPDIYVFLESAFSHQLHGLFT